MFQEFYSAGVSGSFSKDVSDVYPAIFSSSEHTARLVSNVRDEIVATGEASMKVCITRSSRTWADNNCGSVAGDTVDWKMIAIKNNRDVDQTLQIVNYLRCKINANSSNLLTERENIAKVFFAINAFVFSRNHFPVCNNRSRKCLSEYCDRENGFDSDGNISISFKTL